MCASKIQIQATNETPRQVSMIKQSLSMLSFCISQFPTLLKQYLGQVWCGASSTAKRTNSRSVNSTEDNDCISTEYQRCCFWTVNDSHFTLLLWAQAPVGGGGGGGGGQVYIHDIAVPIPLMYSYGSKFSTQHIRHWSIETTNLFSLCDMFGPSHQRLAWAI